MLQYTEHMKTLKDRTLDKVNKKASEDANIATHIVYIEASNPNLILSGPEPVSRAKLAKLIHGGKLLSSCVVDGVTSYRVLI